eukprot:TRINITY_DN18254_c0_g1_i1.p1 TRINITY_DN18254_c0_g1~~TRINITY_DN18254_c0_g1_i1.p1  ORF type:complete len:301 (-),score=42.90 TRINITY_DN18254_c0_g1_i1:34-852(-)
MGLLLGLRKMILSAMKRLSLPCMQFRTFSSGKPNLLEFPYQFGNQLRKGRAVDQRVFTWFPSLKAGIPLAYRTYLKCLQTQDLPQLNEITEGNLYKKIEEGLKSVSEQKLSLTLHNAESNISLTPTELTFIVGGEINRTLEKKQQTRRISHFNSLSPLLIYFPADMSSPLNIIAKIKVELETEAILRASFQQEEGTTYQKNEIHEITFEGICYTIDFPNLLKEGADSALNFITKFGGLAQGKNSEIALKDVTIVDFDDILHGNPHKDNTAIQ